MEEKKNTKKTTKSTIKKTTKKTTAKKTPTKKSVTKTVPKKEEVKVVEKEEKNIIVEEVKKEDNIKVEEVKKAEIRKETFENSNKKGLIITVCMAIILIIGLFFTYTNLLSPKKLFIKSINKGYAKFEKKLDNYKITNKNKKPIIINGDVKFSMDVDENLVDEQSRKSLEAFAKLKLSEKIGVDLKNNEMLFNFRYSYDDDDIFNIGSYITEDKMYMELKNIYDKYIELPMEEKLDFSSMDTNKLSNDELKYLLSKTKDSLLNNMNAKDFKQSTEKIKDGKKTIKVTKITYGLSERSATELMIKFYKEITKDSKYMKILAKLTDTKESEIKKSINQTIKNMNGSKDILSKDVSIKFGVLVQGFMKKHVGYIVEAPESTKFVYYKNKDKKEIRLSVQNRDIIKSGTKGNKTVITLDSTGQELEITIDKKTKGKKTIYEYDFGNGQMTFGGKVIVDKIKENKDGTGETKVSADISMMGLITMKVEASVKAEYVKKLNFPDFSNSIKSEDLTEEEQEKIRENLINNETLKSLTNSFISNQY